MVQKMGKIEIHYGEMEKDPMIKEMGLRHYREMEKRKMGKKKIDTLAQWKKIVEEW